MNKKLQNPTPLASPCISVCTMDETTGYCRGCFRTIEEITHWERYGNVRKQEIIDALPTRRPRYATSAIDNRD